MIEEANWLFLNEDIVVPHNSAGFDALICMGNSFAHLPDFHGNQREQRKAIENFHSLTSIQKSILFVRFITCDHLIISYL